MAWKILSQENGTPKLREFLANRKMTMMIFFEEICNLNQEVQAEKIADFFFSTRNQFQPVWHENFADHISNFDQNIGWGYNNDIYFENIMSPENVQKVIKSLNRKSSSVIGDLPMKLVQMFAEEL